MKILFGLIAAYVMAALLLVFAALFLRKKQYRSSAAMVAGSFVLFVILQSQGIETFRFQNVVSVDQVLCWVFSAAFFAMAIYFTKKDSLSYAFVICLISVFVFFCGLTGVQTLLKTHMLKQVTTSLKSYGDKLDQFQTSVTDMESDLSNQISTNRTELMSALETMNLAKADVAEQQASMRNQYVQILGLQNAIAVAQTNLNEQQKKIEGVEDLVNNLFSRMVYETMAHSDTNKVYILPKASNLTFIAFRLAHVPIQNSVQGTMNATLDGVRPLVPMRKLHRNITGAFFVGPPDAWKNTVFHIQYVKDTAETNAAHKIEAFGTNLLIIDGFELRLNVSPRRTHLCGERVSGQTVRDET